MKLSHDWLKDFLDLRIAPQKLSTKLTMSGLEVENLEVIGRNAEYELGVTPNRSDCLSVIGVAREVAAITNSKLKNTKINPPKGVGRIADTIKVRVKNPVKCPRYTARVIKGVKVGSSPGWIVSRLAAAGIRSINNVVDATNYVMIERGQPLHAFDANMVEGKKIVIKTAGKTKEFRTLDGVDRELSNDDLLICDAKKPIALAAVMGGENSEVSEDTDTLILESAYFEPSGVRRTSKRLQLASESSRRFERGVDPNGVLDALNRLTQIIVEVAGGTPTADWVDLYPKKIKPKKVVFASSEVERVLGVKIDLATIRYILTNLGFAISGNVKRLVVSVPTFRPDITRPIDVIEEIARVYGYDKIPETLPRAAVDRLTIPRTYKQIDLVRNALIDAGFFETLLPAFENEESLSIFSDDTTVATPPVITNPLSKEETAMRTRLLPGLMGIAQTNYNRQQKDVKIFSLQRVYQKPIDKIRASEPLNLAGLMFGRKNSVSWKNNSEEVNFYDAKGVLGAVFSRLGLSDQILYQRGGSYDYLMPGSYANVLLSNQRIGWVGQIHPRTTQQWDIDLPVYAFELDFDEVVTQARRVAPTFRPLSRFPVVGRDLSILVDEQVPHVEIEQTISQSLNTLLTDVRLFDIYSGKGIPSGKKSMAYTVSYASDERTLTDEEVNEAHLRVVAELESKLGAKLR